MDLPLRTRFFVAFIAVGVLSAALTVPAGSILISRMVVREAQRRVDLALTAADDRFRTEVSSAQQAAENIAGGLRANIGHDTAATLEQVRAAGGYDFLHVVDDRGRVVVSARSENSGSEAPRTPILNAALGGRATWTAPRWTRRDRA